MEDLPFGGVADDEQGCFVYECIGHPIQVRNTPTTSEGEKRTSAKFTIEAGELVAIDLIKQSRSLHPSSSSKKNKHKRNGPFLRLADSSGWLFEFKGGERCLRPKEVETGLWIVYVDNFPAGQALRGHPNDRQDFRVKGVRTYQPMQQLYCDRRVNHNGVNYYRVQGTAGWVFDVRLLEDDDDVVNKQFMLLEESMVQTGLFAFQCTGSAGIGIRETPLINEEYRSIWSVSPGQIVVADVIRTSPHPYGNGPFLRLADGSGWLFEKKRDKQLMKEIPIDAGEWTCRIKNPDVGIGLRSQPIDGQVWRCGVDFKPGQVVSCDRRIHAPDGVTFYRVQGRDGWIFDLRDGVPMMELIKKPSCSSMESQHDVASGGTGKGGWTPDFVRGMATACSDDLQEISFNPSSRVISFRCKSDEARINVYYTTRTIGTALEHPSQGKTQLFRRNCSDTELLTIMKDPRVHTNKGYQLKRLRVSIGNDSTSDSVILDGEEVARQALLDCEDKMENLQRKRRQLLSSIRQHDLERQNIAAAAKQKMEMRMAENSRVKEQVQEEERKRIAKVKEQERRRAAELTCQECGRVFKNSHARDQHHRSVHVMKCNHCGRTFTSERALNQHQEAVGHW